MNKKGVYLVSKPLQYFNAYNIPNDQEKDLFIIKSFGGAEDFYKKVLYSTKWNKVYFSNTYDDAFKQIRKNSQKYSKLYIDGDYSFSMIKNLSKLSNIDIFVYEEGMGVYVPNIRLITNQLKFGNSNFFRKLKSRITISVLKLFGHHNYFGGFKKTKGIYLYDKEKHKNIYPKYPKPILEFEKSFLEHLETFPERELLTENFNELLINLVGRDVLIYLTSWEIRPSVSEILLNYPNHIKILKPHPHLTDGDITEIVSYFNHIIKGKNMIEFLISDILKVCKNLIVIHEGSAALFHLNKEEKIEEIIL